MWNPLAPVRSDERRESLAAFAMLWIIMAAHAVIETARDAIFLARIPPERLPWVYLAIAAFALTVTILQREWLARFTGRVGLSLFLLGSSAITLAFFFLVRRDMVPAFYGLYIWSGVFATLVLARFWILAGDLFTVTQAKRLYPIIGAGSVLGAISGSALARYLATRFDARVLLLAAAIILLAATFVPLLLPRGGARSSWAQRAGLSFRAWTEDLWRTTREPYIRRVAQIVLVSSMALTVVDYIFKSSVADSIAPEDLGGFFSTVYLMLNLLSLLVQLSLVGFLIRVLGVSRALLALPLLLILGSAGVIVGGGLAAALVLKAADGGFRHSLHRIGIETLYVPLSVETRLRIKAFVDASGQRGGQALASLAILALIPMGAGVEVLGILVVLLSMGWVFLTLELRRHYLDLFRATLSEGDIQTRLSFPQLDVAALETLMATLNSPDDTEVLATMDLLAEQDRVRLIPALILYHPSRRVVLRGLDQFGKWGRGDWLAMVPRLLENSDPEIRAGALRSSAAVDPDRSILLREFLDDEDATVRATALVGLITAGWLEGGDGTRALEGIYRGASAGEKIALARAIWYQPDTIFTEALLAMAEDPDPKVQYEVARAMDEVGDPRFLPVLLRWLGRRRLRAVVRTALVRIGDEALEFLAGALSDYSLEHAIRRHIPRSISRFGGEEAAGILVDQLLEEPDGMVRFKILRGLGRLRSNDPTLVLDGKTLQRATVNTLVAASRQLEWRTILEEGALLDPDRATPVHQLLVEMLRHKEEHAVERLFRLLGLQYSLDDIRSIYRGLRSARRQVRAGSRELLEHLIPAPLRDAVLALVDDGLSPRARLSGVSAFYQPHGGSYQDILGELLSSGSEALTSLTVYHIAELGLTDMESRIKDVARERSSPLLDDVIEHAQVLLRAPTAERMSYE